MSGEEALGRALRLEELHLPLTSPDREMGVISSIVDPLVQKRRNKAAALKLLRKLLKNQGIHPDTIVTDGLGSYPAAMKVLGCKDRHRPGRLRENNRVENSHLVI